MTPRKEIQHLCDLAKEVREKAQDLYAEGEREEALEAAAYAEGIERACVEIATLNDLPAHAVGVLLGLDLNEWRARFAPGLAAGRYPTTGSGEPVTPSSARGLPGKVGRSRSGKTAAAWL